MLFQLLAQTYIFSFCPAMYFHLLPKFFNISGQLEQNQWFLQLPLNCAASCPTIIKPRLPPASKDIQFEIKFCEGLCQIIETAMFFSSLEYFWKPLGVVSYLCTCLCPTPWAGAPKTRRARHLSPTWNLVPGSQTQRCIHA
jgi:hypothetical protein